LNFSHEIPKEINYAFCLNLDDIHNCSNPSAV
jgi:hypothetical protein